MQSNNIKTLLQNLLRAANKFIRLIFKLKYRESVKNVMQQNHTLTINQLLANELACCMHRYDHGKLPLACQVLQTNNSKSSKIKLRQTRSNSKFFPEYCRINLTKQSIKYKGPVLWSKIPSSINRVANFAFNLSGTPQCLEFENDATEAYDTRMTSKVTVRAARHRVMIELRY